MGSFILADVGRKSIQAIARAIFLVNIFIIFSPLMFFLTRLQASLILFTLSALALIIYFLSQTRRVGVYSFIGFLVLCTYILSALFLNFLTNQDIEAGIQFLFPFIEVVMFILCGRMFKDSIPKLIFVFVLALTIRGLYIYYLYLTGKLWDGSYGFSDHSSYTEVGGILVQRPVDAAISLFSTAALYFSIKSRGVWRLYFGIVFALSVGITLLSLTRSLWIALIISTIFVLYHSRLLIKGVLFTFILAIIAIVVVREQYQQEFEAAMFVIEARAVQTETQVGSEVGSLRLIEIEDAFNQWPVNMVTIFFGRGFSAPIETYERFEDGLEHTPKQFIHNYHVLVLFKTGLVGFALYMFCFYFAWKQGNVAFQSFLIGLFVLLAFQPFVLAFHLMAMAGLLYVALERGSYVCNKEKGIAKR